MVEVRNESGITQVAANVDRVAALEYSFVEDLLALDIKPAAIADDGNAENLFDAVREQVGSYVSLGDRKNPDIEALREAEPQLIIADGERHHRIYRDLEKIAPTILLESFDGNYEQNVESFKLIGKAVSKEQEAKKRVAIHEQKIKQIEDEITVDKHLGTLAAVVTDNHIVGHDANSYVGQFLKRLGFKMAITQADSKTYPEYKDGPYLKLTDEQLKTLNPERLILMVDDENSEALEKLRQSEVYNTINAKKNNRIHFVSRELWAKSRGVIASEYIAADLTKFKE
ncbi:ABC transporter substrate-binding protein [Staphylococcus sp. IVB6181]|uniref:ABC transporter substrate-binding protein n=1 Tax=Staphylococcus sp. IVB6181 TaxID=2929481 RepID=UPI0021D2A052|nr:ABC transporter substrate-binding protein [Staphylococcus sp. IVB6181]UXV34127.1 ABC transporter substrate-binding protein [Staphylococcus sp. IVB6181]